MMRKERERVEQTDEQTDRVCLRVIALKVKHDNKIERCKDGRHPIYLPIPINICQVGLIEYISLVTNSKQSQLSCQTKTR